jgi:hypothetical protein
VYGSRMETVSCIHQLPIQQFQNVKLTFSHPDWSLDPFGYKCSITTRRQNYMIFQTKNHCSTKHHVSVTLIFFKKIKMNCVRTVQHCIDEDGKACTVVQVVH